jgi:hypothetical protein
MNRSVTQTWPMSTWCCFVIEAGRWGPASKKLRGCFRRITR